MGNAATISPELDAQAAMEERKKLPALLPNNIKHATRAETVSAEDLAKGKKTKKKIAVPGVGAGGDDARFQQPPLQQQQQQMQMQQQRFRPPDADEHVGGGYTKEQLYQPSSPSPSLYSYSSQQTPQQAYQQQQYYQPPSAQQHQGYFSQSKEGEEEDEADVQPVDILLQFIPYYGQGDPSNDSIVRATLSGLSINDIDSKDEYGNTLLLLACQYRCEDLVRIMLGKGADPNAINTSGACGLHFACYRESSSLVIARVLLQNGANPEVCELTYGCTPLHYCAGSGDIEFCKLLLSHGAQIGTYDYYNYTCVDYAREAGMVDVSRELQARLDKANQQAALRAQGGAAFALGAGGAGAGAGAGGASPFAPPPLGDRVTIVGEGWGAHVDPMSGGRYFISERTGECLWENDLRLRQHQAQQQFLYQSAVPPPSRIPDTPAVATDAAAAAAGGGGGVVAKEYVVIDAKTEGLLIAQTSRARLIAFLGKHDPARLVEIEQLLAKHKGREFDLFRDLCARYKVAEEGELGAFQAKLRDLKLSAGASPDQAALLYGLPYPSSSPSPSPEKDAGAAAGAAAGVGREKKAVTINTDFTLGRGAGAASSSNSLLTLNTPSASAAAGGAGGAGGSATPGSVGGMGGMGGMDSGTVQALLSEARLKFEAQLEDERAAGRRLLSEKEGLLAKQQNDIEAARREAAALQAERANLQVCM